MDATQSFRLSGTTDVKEIPCDQADGQNVIFWEDIKEVFPEIQYVSCGNVVVKKLRNSEQKRIDPPCIKHYPGVVLDVIAHMTPSSTGQMDDPPQAHADFSAPGDVVERRQVPHLPDTSSVGDNLRTISHPPMPSQIPLYGTRTSPMARLTFKQVVQLAQKKFVHANVEQQMIPSIPFDVQAQANNPEDTHNALVWVVNHGLVVRPDEKMDTSLQRLYNKMDENNKIAIDTNALASKILEQVSEIERLTAKNNELTACVFKLQEELGARQDEMKGLQMKALGRLALLQNSVQALMNQTYELHEYPIPRLFIVLPKDSSSWDPLDLFSNRFRLYFLCECGEHTKSNNSKIPHYIHVAKHEGYDIARPNEFFQQYGPYVLTILRMLKLGITVAGVAVPALSQLVRTDAIDQVATSLKVLTDTIEPGMNQVISYIEKVSEDEGEANQGLEGQMTNNEALEGADLRQLESFLKNKDANRVLGNLYRTVTTEGHVKWVCIDHFRENYHEKAAKAFRDTVEVLYGSFDENIGRVEVGLRSRVQAEQFYLALEKAKSVYELEVTFDNDWDTTQSDFKRLRDALAKSNVGVLDLDLTAYTIKSGGVSSLVGLKPRRYWTPEDADGPTSDILNRSQRYDPIFDIMRHPSIQSVTIRNAPLNFVKRSSLQSRIDEFLSLRHLSIDVLCFTDISGIKSVVAKAPNLSSLTFYRAFDGSLLLIYNAIAKYQTYPVFFQDQSLRILPPMNESSQSTTNFKDMTELLKVLGGRLEAVGLDSNDLSDSAVSGFVKAIDDGSRLKSLRLGLTGQKLSEQCIKGLVIIVARSELRRLDIHLGADEECVHILESIQWEHLRKLGIQLTERGLETRVMRALIGGAKELSGRINLEEFTLTADMDGSHFLSVPEDGLLAAFLSSASLKKLQMKVSMTLEETLSLLRLVDLSQMQRLCLYAEGFDPVEVDALLDCLQHVIELCYISLHGAEITDEQMERMKARGVQLSDFWRYNE
ncbi:hypothetical protein BGX34_002927 [Mortierella sp. NVP85]|nr:hypothetical protein BGX34_002927 [Mortierella sp. NVP85]